MDDGRDTRKIACRPPQRRRVATIRALLAAEAFVMCPSRTTQPHAVLKAAGAGYETCTIARAGGDEMVVLCGPGKGRQPSG